MIRHAARQGSTRALRTYLRYAPFDWGKKALFERVMHPYFTWRRHSAIAVTKFGAKLAIRLPDFIQSRIYYFGIWEPNLTRFIETRLKEGDVFVDVGANIGYFSFLASTLIGPAGRVFAVEASPSIFSLFQGNIALNKASNITAFNLAASDRACSLSIYVGNEGNLGRTSTVETYAQQHGQKLEATIEGKPLPDIVGVENLLSARIIKIDVEGAEASVVRGILPLLHRFSDHTEWVIELSPPSSESGAQEISDLLDSFIDAGYKLHRLANDYGCAEYIRPNSEVKISALAAITTQIDLVATKRVLRAS